MLHDVSQFGLRLQCKYALLPGSQVSVSLKDMIVCGTVQRCETNDGQFAVGILLSERVDCFRKTGAQSGSERFSKS